MSILTRRTVIALALAAAAPPAAAQQAQRPAPSATDPVATLRALYARRENAPFAPFMTQRLRRLYTAQIARSRRANEVYPGLDFQFECGCQDNEPDYGKRNTYSVVSRDERAARILVKATPFADQQAVEIAYQMALENGRWLIADVSKAAGTDGEGWVLSDLLQKTE
ncbi:DUF3828 domain-containing protein [Phreatobacter oligotrophus]|uniref:DUF3828 domain-containing protein n=1 Tax=Phreatobacter oligotrophus TaxID=1122261 RepID=UPI002355C7F0|nr:DUF3828 domain-containing protein [Phreatobacter oligotrophus]MBX9992832.1 YbjP/YqhG family protein [Phreatobacter oligotrophus]